jgi:uncharacterized protein YeaO (DUF488 family)/DNA-binding MarR family transcriptional regulator
VGGVSLTDSSYARLLQFRTGLRQFERWSEEQARAAGLTPAQHQLLLAIRGHEDPRGPTIGEVADYLLLRHHSTVGLVDRADAAGLVSRHRDSEDHRVVRLQLTERGAASLERLSALHLEELARMAPQLSGLWEGLSYGRRPHGFPVSRLVAAPSGERADAGTDPPVSPLAAEVAVARVYDLPEQGGVRVLVDRLWPRGVSREAAGLDRWAKEAAPSPELRRWYGHVPERFAEFARRYRAELARPPAREAVEELQELAGRSGVVLLTATRDVERSGAWVLKEVLETAAAAPRTRSARRR